MELETTPPPVLLPEPTPRSLTKSFHRRRLQVWEGDVRIDDVRGWVRNRRTELHVGNWKRQFGREPTDEELFQLILDDDTQKIPELAGNIYQNGIRIPLILSHDGRLLDGNRRYFASKHLLTKLQDSERADFRRLPAWVLAGNTDAEDEFNVITERNLVNDQKLGWPYYVQALQIYEDFEESGMSVKDIGQRYEWTSGRVRQAIKAVELANEYASYHEDEPKQLQKAYENLIWFDQLQRSHSKLLDGDVEFKEAVFEMIADEPPRFRQARDFVKLGEIRNSEDAWRVLRSTAGTVGLQRALDVVAAERHAGTQTPTLKLTLATKLVADVASHTNARLIEPDVLESFHRLARQVPGGPADPEWQMEKMVEWLNGMKVEEVAALSDGALANLHAAMKRVDAMSRAAGRVR